MWHRGGLIAVAGIGVVPDPIRARPDLRRRNWREQRWLGGRSAQKRQGQTRFLLIRIARERHVKGCLHLLIRIVPRNSENSIGKSSGAVEHPVVVEQIER